jgi:hypothetical protein
MKPCEGSEPSQGFICENHFALRISPGKKVTRFDLESTLLSVTYTQKIAVA